VKILLWSDSREVIIVAGTVGNGPRPHILNSDGQAHPVENVLTIFTLLVGLISFVLGLIVRNAPTIGAVWHIIATVAGLAAILVGLYAQMVSATREQRVLIVAGMIAGFVGLALGLSHGGFVA
jgi:uncharacterized membrane protein HdeD (DUF308 family)